MTATQTVRATPLRAYPGWTIKYNEVTQMYWADQTNGIGIGPGEATFQDALFFVKNGRPPIGDELHA